MKPSGKNTRRVLASLLAGTLLLMAPCSLYASEFLNTIMHINLGFVIGAPLGHMMKKEDNRFESYADTNITGDYDFTNYHSSFGLTLDIVPMPPLILGTESHAIKFGIRGGFRFAFIYQKLNLREENETTTMALLSYKEWMVGPVVHYAPKLDVSSLTGNYTSNFGITVFALYGGLFDTQVNAFPIVRELGGTVNSPAVSSAKGFKIEAGFGLQISVSAINLGVNFFYAFTQLKLDTPITDYAGEVPHPIELHELCLEFYIGIPIEWGTKRIPAL